MRETVSDTAAGSARVGTRAAERFAAAEGGRAAALVHRRPALTLIGAGALSALAMAPFHAWPVLFLTLPLLFWAIEHASGAPAPEARLASGVYRGWAFGLGFHLAGLFWIGSAFLVQPERFALVMPFAVIGMAAGLALFYAAATGATALVLPALKRPLPRIAAFALALMAAEWLRGHILTGFPWNVLGTALTMPLSLLQSAGLVGIYALTAAAVVILTTPLVLAAHAGLVRAAPAILIVSLAPLVAAYVYGTFRLDAHPTAYVPGVALRLVQPSISQRDKFDDTKRRWIFERHLALSAMPPKPRPGAQAAALVPNLVIWPEAAIPFFIRREPAALEAIRNTLPDRAVIIAGTFRINVDPAVPANEVEDYRIFNAAAAIAGDGRLLSIYDKRHLVPFGEYLPAQQLLNALGFENLTRTRGGMAPGVGPRSLLRIDRVPPLEPLICYEVIFPDEIARGNERPGALLNLTNDAWFGRTSGPYQHFHQARLRAVEQGLPLVRSANNGISAVIDPMGRVVARMALGATGFIDHGLPSVVNPPLYARHRVLIETVTAIMLLFWILGGLKVWTRVTPPS